MCWKFSLRGWRRWIQKVSALVNTFLTKFSQNLQHISCTISALPKSQFPSFFNLKSVQFVQKFNPSLNIFLTLIWHFTISEQLIHTYLQHFKRRANFQRYQHTSYINLVYFLPNVSASFSTFLLYVQNLEKWEQILHNFSTPDKETIWALSVQTIPKKKF